MAKKKTFIIFSFKAHTSRIIKQVYYFVDILRQMKSKNKLLFTGTESILEGINKALGRTNTVSKCKNKNAYALHYGGNKNIYEIVNLHFSKPFISLNLKISFVSLPVICKFFIVIQVNIFFILSSTFLYLIQRRHCPKGACLCRWEKTP